MGKLNQFYLDKLQPYNTVCENNEGIMRYFSKVLTKGNRNITILIEYEAESINNSKAPWQGIYYGAFHVGKGNRLSPDEIQFIQRYFYSAYWKSRHPLSDGDVFSIDDEKTAGNNEYWDFWIHLAHEEPIEEACIGLGVIKDALLLLGYEEK